MKKTSISFIIVVLVILFSFATSASSQIDGKLNWLDGNQLEESDDIISELVLLDEKAQQEYIKAGWLHIETVETKHVFDNISSLDETPISPNTTSNKWYLLDSNGYVLQAVHIYDTGNEKTNQVAVYKNSRWRNLSIDYISDPTKFKPSIDWGFLYTVTSFQKQSELTKENLINSDNGKNYTVFSITELFDDLISVGKHKDGTDILVQGFKQEIHYQDGEDVPSVSMAYRILPNGTELLEYSVELKIIENEDAVPQDIEELLNNQ